MNVIQSGAGTSVDVRALAERFGERDGADSERYPAENIADLHEAGVIAAPLPPSLGGMGWTPVDSVHAVEAVASRSPSTALLLSMPLGLAGILALGPEVAPGEHRPAWGKQIERMAAEYRAQRFYAACNSERGAGGSLEATKTHARRGDGGGFRLTGEKILASGGRYADWFFSSAKVPQDDVPGAGVVEFFLLRTQAPGVEILTDWDGFGMRSTESQTVRYEDAVAEEMLAFPNFLALVQPTSYWYCLFAAIPLGCAAGILEIVGTPEPQSPALRLRLQDARMRYEALRAYLVETAALWRPAAGPAYGQRVLRTKTYVTQEATKLCAELFALSGGRHYRRTGAAARLLADSFAGTALRPPLALALDQLLEQFGASEADA